MNSGKLLSLSGPQLPLCHHRNRLASTDLQGTFSNCLPFSLPRVAATRCVKMMPCVLGEAWAGRRLPENGGLPPSPGEGQGSTAALRSKCPVSTLRSHWHIIPTCSAGRASEGLFWLRAVVSQSWNAGTPALRVGEECAQNNV